MNRGLHLPLIATAVWAVGCLGPVGEDFTNVPGTDYTEVGFDRLADFKYEVPDGALTEPAARAVMARNRIPRAIAKLDGQKVAVAGYMLPLRVESGKITEFLVLRDQSLCCYGAVPKINEWISVRTPKGKGIPPAMDRKLTFYGVLKVGEIVENGYLVGIYEMDAEPRFAERELPK